jgi:hypothetical protein
MKIHHNGQKITLIGNDPKSDRPLLQKLLTITRYRVGRRCFAVFIDGEGKKPSHSENTVPFVDLECNYASARPFLEEAGIMVEVDKT